MQNRLLPDAEAASLVQGVQNMHENKVLSCFRFNRRMSGSPILHPWQAFSFQFPSGMESRSAEFQAHSK
jgi:hypothetical protein